MSAWFGFNGWRALLVVATLFLFAGNASAQMCPSPYTQGVSQQTGAVCEGNCALGSYPSMANAKTACEPGYAPTTCPDGDSFLVMTPGGPVCQKGYTPIDNANNGASCKAGDLRVERPPYQLNGALVYETCAPAPNCPTGYIETVDPDNALGTSRVCMLPCQDFVMNQGMACSCGSGGRLAAQTSGAPVKQICQPICPAGTQWQASSPLFAFTAEQGQCVPTGGGPAVAATQVTPTCPGSSYWNGQVCLPIGGISEGFPVIGYRGCPPGTHWNGSHCVPNGFPLPVCGPGTTWNGLFCVVRGPQPCPVFEKWNGNQCVPIVQQICPPNEYWNGSQCVPKPVTCTPGQIIENGVCVTVKSGGCVPPNRIVNGVCVAPTCPPGQILENDICVIAKTGGCVPPNRLINGVCVLPPTCPPGQILKNGVCASETSGGCVPPNRVVNGVCVLPPNCKPGEVLENGACVFENSGTCPPPKRIINGHCVDEPRRCPPGQISENGVCVTEKSGGCVPPNRLVNGVCEPAPKTCPPGQKLLQNGLCVVEKH
jgi:hypothetical protein